MSTDVASGAAAERSGRAAARDYERAGDPLVVWRHGRLGRSLRQRIERMTALDAQHVGFRSRTESIDPTTSGGKLVCPVFAARADVERDLIRARTVAGLVAARARGRCGGRPRARRKTPLAMAKVMLADRDTPVQAVCDALRSSRATRSRDLAAERRREAAE